jgi:WD40 repeat protein
LVTPPPWHVDDISSVAITSDGNHIVSGSRDKSIRVWDADTGEASVSPLQGHTEMVYSVTTLPDGRIVSGSYDRTIWVWGAETGRAPVTPLLGHDSHKVQSVAISSYENRIVSRSYDGIIVAMEKIL